MININIDNDIVNKKLDEAINAKVEELAYERYFLTYDELAKFLNLSKPTIEDIFIKNGKLKYYKMGSKYLFKRTEVCDLLDSITEKMDSRNNDFKLINS